MFDGWQGRVLYLLLVEVPDLARLCLATAVFLKANWRVSDHDLLQSKHHRR